MSGGSDDGRRPGDRPELVPRYSGQGYAEEHVEARRAWAEAKTGARLTHVARASLATEEMRGNIENPIGAAQVPLGLAGPLEVRGEHAQDTYYVPFATTEGALVRSYERGMMLITRAGGAETRIWNDENRVAPIFHCRSVAAAFALAQQVADHEEGIRAAAEATTQHGRLLSIEAHPAGRDVIVNFRFSTGDAHGMNMIVKAADAAAAWLVENTAAESYEVFSGWSAEKRAAGSLFQGGKGKRVTAGVLLPRRLVQASVRQTPEQMVSLWHRTVLGHLTTGALGYNGHYANGLTALFIATGQDVANVANSAVGVTHLEITDEGDLYASALLPSLTVATVGGGTAQGTARECLELLGCFGSGKAKKLAEIAAATVLAGELSMAGAIASGEFVAAHETYGRNRPQKT